jgi:hypothetical protein
VLSERACRPLDVGEEEGERAGRQARFHTQNLTPVVFEVRPRSGASRIVGPSES